MMTAVEQLACQIRDGQDPDGQMMLALLARMEGLTIVTAKPFVRSGFVDSEELPSIAFLAASEAVHKWEYDAGMAFLTFYRLCLLSEITRTTGSVVHVPYAMRLQLRHYKMYVRKYGSEHGGDFPSDREICKALSIGAKDLDRIRAAQQAFSASSIDAPLSANEDGGTEITLADIICTESDEAEAVTDAIWHEELAEAVTEALKRLAENERTVITLRYKSGLTTAQTAERMHLQVNDVRNVERKAVRRLRAERRGLEGFLEQRTLARETGFSSWAQKGASSPELLVMRFEQHDYGKWN